MNNKGYTLIEFIIVLSIIMVMSSLAFIGLNKGYKLNGATRMIYADLQYARIRAIKEKKGFEVLFADNGHTYQINNLDVGITVLARDIQEQYHGVTFVADTNPRFDPVGTANSGNILLTKGFHSKTITFKWTGRIEIQ